VGVFAIDKAGLRKGVIGRVSCYAPTISEEIMSILKIPAGAEYDPNRVLDAIMMKLKLKNDAALSRVLEVAPPVISKIRHNTLPIGATILLRMHEVSNFSIRELRALMVRSRIGTAAA
jgi:hypothetical protein